MKYNTFLSEYPHRAIYQTWELELNNDNGYNYRIYDDPVTVNCRVALNGVGSVTLFSREQLQGWGLVQGFRDASTTDSGLGKEFLREDVYSIIKSVPLINPMGIVYGYAHSLTIPTNEQINGPVNPRVPLWDQSL